MNKSGREITKPIQITKQVYNVFNIRAQGI